MCCWRATSRPRKFLFHLRTASELTVFSSGQLHQGRQQRGRRNRLNQEHHLHHREAAAREPPELFGSILGTHFIQKYSHIHAAHVHIVTHRWVRMQVDGKPHPHSFVKDSPETRDVQVDVVEGKGISINSSIQGLTVLKSTGSQFWGFVRDEYTTLKETWDRILSTDVAANWQWRQFTGLAEVRTHADKFNPAWEAARAITLKTFAEDNSASVQATMYLMGEKILAAAPLVDTVEYALPNNHYFEVGMYLFHPLFFCLD